MLHKTFVASLLLSVAFVPQAFAGFEFVSPVAPIASSQQAQPVAAPLPSPLLPQASTAALPQIAPAIAVPKATTVVAPATPTSPKMQGLMKPSNFVPAVKADESDALLLSDEVLAEPPKPLPSTVATSSVVKPLAPAPALPSVNTPAATKPDVKPALTAPALSPALPPAVAPTAPKVTSGAALPPVVQADTNAVKAAPVTYEVAQGFGKQVPLALALRQIVPANYRFSFANGVNAGQMVDWQGGAPWDQVVSRVAKENALLVRITNQVVLIEQDPNGVRAPVLGAYTPASVVPTLPPLGAVDMPKKAPAFAGDNPLVLALGETLPTRDTEDMSLTQPRRSFKAPIALTAPLPAVTKAVPAAPTPTPTQVKAPALPTALVAMPASIKPSTDKLLAEKAAQPALAPVTPPAPVEASKAADLPASLPPLPKARTIEVAAAEQPPVVAAPILPAPSSAPKAMVTTTAKPATVVVPVAKPVTTSTPVAKPPALPPLEESTEIKPAPKAMLVLPAAPVLNAAKAMPQAVETDKAVQQTWVAEKGQTMRQAFAAWAPDAGVTLIWSAAYDYPLQTDVAINGTFQDAVRTMLDGFSKAQPRPVGRLHKNGATGNAVLVVETRQATE